MSPKNEFDIQSINQRLYLTRRPGRYLGLALAAGLTIIVIVVTIARLGPIVDSVARLSQMGVVYLFVVALVLGFAVLLGSLYFTFAPGPGVLRLDESGLRIIYLQGSTRVLRWSDSDLRFKLLDFSTHQAEMGDYGSIYFLELRRGQWTALTPEAFQSILEAAKAHGLQVTSFLGFAGYGYPPVVNYVHHHGAPVRHWFQKPLHSNTK